MGRNYDPAWDMDPSNEYRWQFRLSKLLGALPLGENRVAHALIESPDTTYPDVAAVLGVHLGTVHRQMYNIRRNHPKIYRALMTERRRLLAIRHDQAVKRHELHTQKWREYQLRIGAI